MRKQVEFGADRVKVNGPLSGGEYTITFYTGEYQKDNVAEVLKIPPQRVLKVTVEYEQ